MFHIIFNADQNYMKYVAVLITNIIHYTDTSKRFADFLEAQDSDDELLSGGGEQYHFHIITDSVQSRTLEQFDTLQATLSETYPCRIHTHIIDNKEFESLPKWGFESAQLHAAYYRIALTRFLPEGVQKCLYLDTDMLVLSDLRELFAYDLRGYIAASSTGGPDSHTHKHPVRRRKRGGGKRMVAFETSFYFCSGLMLVNVPEWKKHSVESCAMSFLACYDTEFADQDALNFAMRDKVRNLGVQWGILAYQYIWARYDSNKEYASSYEEAMQGAKIIHCNGPAKAWFGAYERLANFMPNQYPHKYVWCEMAKLCASFKQELIPQMERVENEGLHEYTLALARELQGLAGEMATLQRRVDRIVKPHKAFARFIKKLFSRSK